MSTKKNKKTHWDKIVCPFFHNDNRNSIVCEGFYSDSVVRHTFRCDADRIEWQQIYCTQYKAYKMCPFYEMSAGKYED